MNRVHCSKSKAPVVSKFVFLPALPAKKRSSEDFSIGRTCDNEARSEDSASRDGLCPRDTIANQAAPLESTHCQKSASSTDKNRRDAVEPWDGLCASLPSEAGALELSSNQVTQMHLCTSRADPIWFILPAYLPLYSSVHSSVSLHLTLSASQSDVSMHLSVCLSFHMCFRSRLSAYLPVALSDSLHIHAAILIPIHLGATNQSTLHEYIHLSSNSPSALIAAIAFPEVRQGF
eukprot:scaffold285255_cov21-Prasinocladus_malaysianus.AAC.1